MRCFVCGEAGHLGKKYPQFPLNREGSGSVCSSQGMNALIVKLQVNGRCVQALIDTGCTVTLVTIWLMDILGGHRGWHWR